MNADQTIGVGIVLVLVGTVAACSPWIVTWWQKRRSR